MKPGKISENVLKRSVLRQINKNYDILKKGAGIGNDCALFASFQEDFPAVSTGCMTIKTLDAVEYAIFSATNNLAAEGVLPVGILLSFFLPPETEEAELKSMMQSAQKLCRELGIDIAGGHTEITSAVNQAVVNVTAIGKKSVGYMPESIRPGQDVVISKWIGLEATAMIAAEKTELSDRFPQKMLVEAKGYKKYLSVIPEAATAVKSGVSTMHDVRGGGIFAALWEMAAGAGVGLIMDLKKLPIKQATVEICNFYDLNPYEILSAGSLIMVTADGEGLVRKLAEEGIHAVIAGKTTEGNDRILQNGDEVRYLEPPKPDEILKLFA